MGPKKLVTWLHRLIVRIWETEQLPEDYKEGVICPIYKKGERWSVKNSERSQCRLQSDVPDHLPLSFTQS
ncbi:hypothetical protein RP20_CCG004148 [Aedes albopictus]|nr:hypothetical protein RP20_CCG004148 [Aedes albopictus]